jgi:hypothetical protein
VYTCGLLMDGARFNTEKMSRLDGSRPKQLYTECPVMHMDPVDNRQPSTGGVYRTPVYREQSRKGHVHLQCITGKVARTGLCGHLAGSLSTQSQWWAKQSTVYLV